MTAKRILSTFHVAVLTASACAPDPYGTPIDAAIYDAGGRGNVGTASAGGCSLSTPVPVNPGTLPSCCTTGSAHCEASSNVDPAFASELASCPGGVCVPDPFLENPNYGPKSCASIGGAAGVCLSTCIPQIAQYGTLLPVDVCDPGDRCAPCISPLDQESTGACNLGKPTQTTSCGEGGLAEMDAGAGKSDGATAAACPHAGPPIIDPSTLPPCGPAGGAHCLGASLVPASEVSQLAPCGGGYCVPDTFIESGGEFIPPSCSAAGSIEGRCLNECLPAVTGDLASLVVSTCASYERCVPCFNPLTGIDTGACRLGCDPGPNDPPALYPTCCTSASAPAPLGTCIPTVLIATSQQGNLAPNSCASGSFLCVPDEQLKGVTPPSCTATPLVGGTFTGVCLSTCLSFDLLSSLGIAQGTCDDVHVCAPCTNPITQQPTGAPGCPP